ncbi:unnamed protein product [Rotaria sordida]|uniref:Uncharacterized protein n=1 Tax=Rotaria sordida TaxID=392033 RepID=A0A813PQF3_9BILA|nr:unnamed protein product [Rotaria sordida]CAF0787034.1 unnamed protein product [Rotaria sordida]
MPRQNECLSFSSNPLVSRIDYSEAQNILELTTTKQKQLRRERSQVLYKQVLLKRTYTLVCDLLDSDCSYSSSSSTNQTYKCSLSPLSTIDTNKRKLSSDDHEIQPIIKKSTSLMDKCYDIKNDNDVLQFLRELNSVKVTSSDDNEQNIPIIVFLVYVVVFNKATNELFKRLCQLAPLNTNIQKGKKKQKSS